MFTGIVFITGDSSMKDKSVLPTTITLNTKAFILWATSNYLCTVGSKDEMYKINNRG